MKKLFLLISKFLLMVGVISVNISLFFSAMLPRILHVWLVTTDIEFINYSLNIEVLQPTTNAILAVSIIEIVLGVLGILFFSQLNEA